MTAAKPMKPPSPIAKPAAFVPPKPTWSLADVSSGRKEKPHLLLVKGVEGIGKSTFAASAPKPIFLDAEDGSNHLNVSRLPRIRTWSDALHGLRLLINEKHDYQTLVVDTVDELEQMNWEFICARDGKANIEDYGWQRGQKGPALEQWRRFVVGLDALRSKGMHIILLGHTQVRTYKNPQGADYDRYELTLHPLSGGLLKGWCEAVFFANYETWSVKASADDRKGKAVASGRRLLYTERTAAYDAKNRYGLPPEIALSWDEFEQGVAAGRPSDPAFLIEQITRQLQLLDEAKQEKVTAAVGRANGDALKLSIILNLVNSETPAGQAEQEA